MTPDPDPIALSRTRPWVVMPDTPGIPGWYGYRPFWEKAVATAPPGAVLVEVGVFCGRSLADLAVLARDSGKDLTVIGVDTFGGSEEHGFLAGLPRGALAREAWVNLDAAGVLGDVTLLVSDSVRAARLFPGGSVWAVFLDADHSEAAVAADVRAWALKLSSGGWLGGDDVWVFPGVKAAVDRLIPRADYHPDRCWWEVRASAPR